MDPIILWRFDIEFTMEYDDTIKNGSTVEDIQRSLKSNFTFYLDKNRVMQEKGFSGKFSYNERRTAKEHGITTGFEVNKNDGKIGFEDTWNTKFTRKIVVPGSPPQIIQDDPDDQPDNTFAIQLGYTFKYKTRPINNSSKPQELETNHFLTAKLPYDYQKIENTQENIKASVPAMDYDTRMKGKVKYKITRYRMNIEIAPAKDMVGSAGMKFSDFEKVNPNLAVHKVKLPASSLPPGTDTQSNNYVVHGNIEVNLLVNGKEIDKSQFKTDRYWRIFRTVGKNGDHLNLENFILDSPWMNDNQSGNASWKDFPAIVVPVPPEQWNSQGYQLEFLYAVKDFPEFGFRNPMVEILMYKGGFEILQDDGVNDPDFSNWEKIIKSTRPYKRLNNKNTNTIEVKPTRDVNTDTTDKEKIKDIKPGKGPKKKDDAGTGRGKSNLTGNRKGGNSSGSTAAKKTKNKSSSKRPSAKKVKGKAAAKKTSVKKKTVSSVKKKKKTVKVKNASVKKSKKKAAASTQKKTVKSAKKKTANITRKKTAASSKKKSLKKR